MKLLQYSARTMLEELSYKKTQEKEDIEFALHGVLESAQKPQNQESPDSQSYDPSPQTLASLAGPMPSPSLTRARRSAPVIAGTTGDSEEEEEET
jgi:hypothetical protein